MLLRGRHRHVAGTVVVELDGEADLASLPQLTQALSRGIDVADSTVIVDLDGLAVVDDAALGLLVGAAATARRRGIVLSLLAGGPRIRERLRATRLDEIIEVHEQLPLVDDN